MKEVELATLAPGTAFRATWRPADRNVGELLDIGTGSCGVRMPLPDGTGWETSRWSRTTMIVPATREELNIQSFGDTKRNRSTADNPVERVHELCNEMKSKPRDEIIAACVAEGINPNTAKTQYYRWRKTQ